eukprot:Gregarina_sp_Poly_1__6321@NODE_3360_length_1152_cov_1606_446083_g2127_i0_p1_GENE_NODE_3360_length_1152_cov_1606_446083_g2127_i0NODE_3360_length_1152_cov_1606_446083_g2127_i0_p1_ORF_typecomplete_len301_score28_59_NODE_3360_length_1152_cov_1606_446083_g2127_i01261028
MMWSFKCVLTLTSMIAACGQEWYPLKPRGGARDWETDLTIAADRRFLQINKTTTFRVQSKSGGTCLGDNKNINWYIDDPAVQLVTEEESPEDGRLIDTSGQYAWYLKVKYVGLPGFNEFTHYNVDIDVTIFWPNSPATTLLGYIEAHTDCFDPYMWCLEEYTDENGVFWDTAFMFFVEDQKVYLYTFYLFETEVVSDECWDYKLKTVPQFPGQTEEALHGEWNEYGFNAMLNGTKDAYVSLKSGLLQRWDYMAVFADWWANWTRLDEPESCCTCCHTWFVCERAQKFAAEVERLKLERSQ